MIQLEPDEVAVPNAGFDLHREGQLNNLPPDQTADWILNASIDALNLIPKDATMRYEIVESVGGRLAGRGALTQVNNTGDVITGLTTLKASDYTLWWPAGMGAQNLYNVTVDVVSGSGKTITSVTKRLGFRTIVLNMGIVTDEERAQGIAPGNHCEYT